MDESVFDQLGIDPAADEERPTNRDKETESRICRSNARTTRFYANVFLNPVPSTLRALSAQLSSEARRRRGFVWQQTLEARTHLEAKRLPQSVRHIHTLHVLPFVR